MKSFSGVQSEDAVKIIAPTVEEGALALITFLIWIHSGRPRGLKFIEVLQEQCPDQHVEVAGIHHHVMGLLHGERSYEM